MTIKLFDPEVEVAFISIILNNPSKILEIHDFNPSMLSIEPHRIIFKLLKDLLEENLNPDMRLIVANLQSKGVLEEVGGEDYLKYLYDLSVDSTNLKEFERIVVDSYKAIKLLQITKDANTNLKNPANVDNLILTLRNQLDSLTQVGNGSYVSKLGDLLKDSWDSLLERIENPGISGLTTGNKEVDMITAGMNPAELWFIASRPGHGKTSLMLDFVLEGAKQGISSLIFSLEMDKRSLLDRLISMETGIPLSPNIRMGSLSTVDLELIKKSFELFKTLPIYIDSSFTPSLGYLETTVRKYKYKYNIDMAWLDYIQILAERGADQTAELGRISRRAKLLAGELEIVFGICSQLNRQVEMRDDKRPRLADLRQSGNLEEDGDVVVGLYRDSKYNKDTKDKGIMEFILLKQRNGPTGSIFLKYDEQTNKIK